MIQQPTVVFDDGCAFCTLWVARLRRLPHGDRILWIGRASQEAEVLIPPGGLPESLILIDGDGRHAGSEAVLRTLLHAGAPGWLVAMAKLVPRGLRETGYRWVARNRHRLCRGSACATPQPDRRSQR